MKKILIIVGLIMCCYAVNAQFINDFITFETPDSLVRIDTALAGNIWQIGQPQKVFFDSAYTVPNAIVTGLVNNYPKGNYSTFTVKITDTSEGWIPYRAGVIYVHKFDTDSLHDGGYIEDSYDGGSTWMNIENDPFALFHYYPEQVSDPVIANGNFAYTGRSTSAYGFANGWRQDQLMWCFPGMQHPVYLRFVFFSDTIQTNHEGWMVDNIQVYSDICEGINELNDPALLTISPNPACDILKITRKNTAYGDCMIYNELGRTCFKQDHFNGESIDVSGFPEGSYVLRYSDNKSFTVKKFVVIR
jgi:hypothetical protein